MLKILNKNSSIICSLAILIMIKGCNNIPDCTNDTEPNEVIVEFFNSTDSTAMLLTVDSIKALSTDSIFFQDTTLSTFDLALSPTEDITMFLFYTSTTTDTLTLTYVRNVSILSEECGPTIGFSNISESTNSFDSVAIVNDFLNRQLSENVEVYN